MENKEPRLYRRNRTWWIKYYVQNGQGDRLVRRSLKTNDEGEAKKRLIEIAYKRNEGTLREPSRSFLSTIAVEYESFLKGRVVHKSWMNDISYLRRFLTWLKSSGFRRLEEITSAVILRYLTETREARRWKPKTWNRALGAIRGLFKYALKHTEFVSLDPRHENPAAAVDQLKVPHPVIRYLDRDQIRAQLEALESHPQMKAIVATLIFAGLRREELTWLRREDVDFRAGAIRITSKEVGGDYWTAKTNKDRRVPISSDLLRILSEYEGLRPEIHTKWLSKWELLGSKGQPPADPIWFFPAPAGGRWDPDNLSQSLAKIQSTNSQGYKNGTANRRRPGVAEALESSRKPQRCGSADFHPWTCLHFRHTFATQLAARGVTLDRIAKLMGNSVLICERHYAAFATDQMKEDVEMGVYAGDADVRLRQEVPAGLPSDGHRQPRGGAPGDAKSPDQPGSTTPAPRSRRATGRYRPCGT